MEMRSNNLRVSRSAIQWKARDLSTMQGFKASKGWLFRFMKHHGLTLLCKTTACQSTPADSIPKLISDVMHLQNLRKKHQYQLSSIFAMDETACWMDMPSDTTADPVGARLIPIKTTGYTKDHYT